VSRLSLDAFILHFHVLESLVEMDGCISEGTVFNFKERRLLCQSSSHPDVSYCNAIELNPNYSWSHKNLGDLLAAQGKIDEATVCYRRAIKLKPRIS